MKTHKRWTAEEDNILSAYVEVSSSNLNLCFIAAGKKLDRDPKSCKNRWYNYLRKESTVFMLPNTEKNVKNEAISRKKVTKKVSILNRVKKLFKKRF